MAKNIDYFIDDSQISVTVGASKVSGDLLLVGTGLIGVLLTSSDSNNKATMRTKAYVSTTSVKGIDGGGNVAVAIGDALYYVTADTPPVSKKTTGVFLGYALAAVTSGATTTISYYRP